MASTVSKVVSVAKAEVGYREGFSGGHYNNKNKYAPAVPTLEWANFQPWCATFVSWVALKAGCPGLYPVTASCDVAGNWFKSRNRWSEYPAVGAQVFFGYPNDLNHTGIVYAYDADYIYTVEGNTNDSGSREGNGVYLKKRARRGVNVIGYGYPDFPEGIDSADPAWAAVKPRVVEPEPKRKLSRGKSVDASIKAARQAAKEARRRKRTERLRLLRDALRTLRKIKAR